MEVDLKTLFARLNPFCYQAMDAAANACVARGGYEIGVDDLLLQWLDAPDCDATLLMKQQGVEVADLNKAVHAEIEATRKGNPGKPVFSAVLVSLLQEAWTVTTLGYEDERVRSAYILLALLRNRLWFGLKSYADLLAGLTPAAMEQAIAAGLPRSKESAEKPGAGGGDEDAAAGPNLQRFTVNFSERAAAGRLDPVFCRDREIRQMIDILGRRQKNNPILVGEPGVGKTAVVEGLALRIHQGEVPDVLKNAAVLALDLGALQAGASVKGEFEKRLNGVLKELKDYPRPVVLFIDEAHTLIGAGGQAGGGDAANLLKPALARGELRAIAATTWSEYRKYFEKDPALARRFQLVKLPEPTVEQATIIMRGLRPRYEAAHGVYVRDDAIAAAATLAARYITGRQLPDKAVDVLDTACARVGIGLSSKPDPLDDVEKAIAVLEREKSARQRDVDQGAIAQDPGLGEFDARIDALKRERAEVERKWLTEKALVENLLDLRRSLAEKSDENGRGVLRGRLDECRAELDSLAADGWLVPYEVTPEVVQRVISDWTGVPLGKIVVDEADVLLNFGARMQRWVKGQRHATAAIGERIRTSKAGLGNPEAPIGVFLLVGPSGVGKTETAIAVAEMLFGGRQALTTVNMSEFQEKHTISRLIGSPPGYVGYGEGGVLTEAVRRRPYSVVLLDEVEKADLEVLNLFYNVFDKGILNDGEGREISFRNTVIFLTSNLATDLIMDAWQSRPEIDPDELAEMIRPSLTKFLKPALLARMEVIPYFGIGQKVLREIVGSKLERVRARLNDTQGVQFGYGEDLVDFIASRCTDVNSGARNIDYVINRYVLPTMARDVLSFLGEPERGPSGFDVIVENEEVRTTLSA